MLAHSGLKLPLSIYRILHIPQIMHRKLNSFFKWKHYLHHNYLVSWWVPQRFTLKKTSFNLMFGFKGIVSHDVSNCCHIKCITTYLWCGETTRHSYLVWNQGEMIFLPLILKTAGTKEFAIKNKSNCIEFYGDVTCLLFWNDEKNQGIQNDHHIISVRKLFMVLKEV